MFAPRTIEDTIKVALRRKMATYNPEPSKKPFHTRLLGEDRMALFAFIQSLNTTFGTAIFENVAEQIATGIYSEEIERIREHCRSGERIQKRMRRVDIYLNDGNTIFLIDLKTAKPNVSGFEKYKQDMLEWAATVLYQNPDADVRTIIAIPYNPYDPNPYSRWTLRGMLEIENQSQLMVAQEFWNFLAGGDDVYQDLLDCFENVGINMRDEIDDYFKEFTQQNDD